MLYSMTDTDLDSSLFFIKLSNDQKAYLNSILPKGYSLQPGVPNVTHVKNPHPRKININHKEQSMTEREQGENKRRKNKIYDEIPQEDKQNSFDKRQELAKKAIIIKKLKKHDSSWPFRTPVDPKALLIPNYTQIVLTPMDLQTIEQKLKNEKYEHPSQVQRDINQMLLNSYKFNSKDSEYFQATAKLEEYYYSLINQCEGGGIKKELPDRQKKKQETQGHNHENEKGNQISQFQKDILSLLKRANQLSGQKQVRQKPVYASLKQDGSISVKQKRQLAQDIRSLQQNHLSRIIQIIRQTSKQGHQLKIDEKTQKISIDIEKLDNKTVRQLQNYIRLQRNSIVHDREQSMIDSQENLYSVC